nr:immunoglobulin light chain junction region [Macaca mulatta]
CQQGNTSPWTF